MTTQSEPTFAERAANMIAPGQESAVDEFLKELEERDAIEARQAQPQGEPQQQLLAGKFKTSAELERAYLEAQQLIGRRGQQQSEAEPEAAPQPLTREQTAERYGEAITAAAEAEGLDLSTWDARVRRGEDTKELREKLAARLGIAASLIEQHEAQYRPQAKPDAAPAAAPSRFSDADVAELRAIVGGDKGFVRLSQWAQDNLSAEEIGDYNAAVDSGDKAVARMALRSLQARSTAPAPRGEPELIGGGTPAKATAFSTQADALKAMRVTDERGRRKYDTDPDYQRWYDGTMARSNF